MVGTKQDGSEKERDQWCAASRVETQDFLANNEAVRVRASDVQNTGVAAHPTWSGPLVSQWTFKTPAKPQGRSNRTGITDIFSNVKVERAK
jgi:hypothetical protein